MSKPTERSDTRLVTRRQFLQGCGAAMAGGLLATAVLPARGASAAQAPRSSSAGGKVVVWYDTGAAWSDLIADWQEGFARVAPGVELEWVTQDALQIQAKLLTAFAAGQGPDVAFAHRSNLIPSEFEHQAWENLGPYLAGDADLQASYNAIPQGIRESFVRGQKVWGSPSNAALVAFFVRASWLDKVGAQPPRDWQEIVEVAKQFQEADLAGGGTTIGYGPFGAPGYDGALGQWQYFGIHSGWRTPVIDTEGRPSFKTDHGLAIAQFYADLVHKHRVVSPDITTWTFKEFYQAVQAGKVGMGRLGSWNVPAWKNSAIGEDFIAMEFPPMTRDQKEPNYQYQSSNGIAVSRSSANKEAAIAWVKYFLSEPAQTAMFKRIGACARFDLPWDELLQGNPRLEFFFKQQHQWLGSLDVLPTFLPVGNELGNTLNKMLADESYTPNQALADAYELAVVKYREVTGKDL